MLVAVNPINKGLEVEIVGCLCFGLFLFNKLILQCSSSKFNQVALRKIHINWYSELMEKKFHDPHLFSAANSNAPSMAIHQRGEFTYLLSHIVEGQTIPQVNQDRGRN